MKHRLFALLALGLATVATGFLHQSAALADQAATDSDLPLEELRVFAEVFGRIKNDYVEPVDDRILLNYAIEGMLSGLDPHSAYLDEDDYRDLRVGTSGEFGGLGIEVGMEDGFVKVISPIDDTPAKRAGVKSGDLIIRLDDQPVKGMSLDEAVTKLKGPKDTQVNIQIVRRGLEKPLPLAITRMSFDSYRTPIADDGTLPVSLFGKPLNLRRVARRDLPWLICYGTHDDLVEKETALAPLDHINAEVTPFPKGHVAIATSWSFPQSACALHTRFGNGDYRGPVRYHMDLDVALDEAKHQAAHGHQALQGKFDANQEQKRHHAQFPDDAEPVDALHRHPVERREYTGEGSKPVRAQHGTRREERDDRGYLEAAGNGHQHGRGCQDDHAVLEHRNIDCRCH